MPRKRFFSHCAIVKCQTKYDGRISFFRFPKENREKCIEWLRLCGRIDLMDKDCYYLYNKLTVCGQHFETNMSQNHLRNKILPNARPTKCIPDTGEPEPIPQVLSTPTHPVTHLDEPVGSCSTFLPHVETSQTLESKLELVPQVSSKPVHPSTYLEAPVAGCFTFYMQKYYICYAFFSI